MNTISTSCIAINAKRQSGATLFVALIMLVVVTLLGLSVAQVTMLQERMANNYQSDMIAFQNAEARLRQAEADLSNSSPCGNSEDPVEGVIGAGLINNNQAANLGETEKSGLSGEDVQVDAVTEGDINCIFFHVAAIASDVEVDPTSSVLLESVYIRP